MLEQFQYLFGSLQRLGNFPLDSTSIFESEDKLNQYILNNKTVYHGQLVTVLNDTNKTENVFVIIKNTDNSFTYKRVGHSEDEIKEIVKEVAEGLDSILKEELLAALKEFKLDVEENFIQKTDFEKTVSKISSDLDGKITSVSDTVNEILKRIENGEIGSGGNGNIDCNCPEMTPYTEEDINNLFTEVVGDCSGVIDNIPVFEEITTDSIESVFNEIHNDCDGIEDEEPVIESIPLDSIESVFNDINGDCDGVDDDKEITEAIPQSSIESLFNNINKC